MDINNPAVANKTLFSPRDLELIQEDPSRIEQYARAMGVVNLENLFKSMQHPDVSPNSKIEFQKLLNKLGKLDTTATDAPPNAQVVINIIRAAGSDTQTQGITIQGTALPVDDDA